MPSSRHTKTPASQATRIPRQIRRGFEAKKTGDLGLGIWYNRSCQEFVVGLCDLLAIERNGHGR